MADNPEVVELLRKVGETPGYRLEEQPSGKWRVIRREIEAPDGTQYPAASKDVSLAHKLRTWENCKHSITERTGWTSQLHADMEDIQRKARILQQPKEETHEAIQARLLEAVGWEPKPEEEPEDTADVVKRHGKGGTVTGSRQAKFKQVKASSGDTEWSQPVPADQQKYPPIRCEIIGPDRAAWLLERMPAAPYQRMLSETYIKELAEIYGTPGAYVPNPADPLCFDTEERNANGHHRLWAIIISGTSQYFWVAYNVDPRAYEVMDKGRKRTTRDAMWSLGYREDPALLGHVLRDLYLWFKVPDQEEWSAAEHRNVPDIMRRQLLEEHPGILASIRLGKLMPFTRKKHSDKKGYALSRRAAVFVHYLIARACGGDPVPVTAWYRALEMLECAPGTPGHTLQRYYAFQPAAPRPRERLSNARKKELDMRNLLSAWNHTAEGKGMVKMSYPGANFKIHPPQRLTEHHTAPLWMPSQAADWKKQANEAMDQHHLATASIHLEDEGGE